MTKTTAISRILTIVGEPRQTDSVVQQALAVYDRLVKSRFKKALPVIDTTQADAERKAREAAQDRSMETSTPAADQHGAKPDTRPFSPNSWRVKRPSGAIWTYHMSPDGAVSSHEAGKYRIPLIDLSGWHKIHAAHLAIHEKNLPPSAPPQEEKTVKNLMLKVSKKKPVVDPEPIRKSSLTPQNAPGLFLKRPFVEKGPRVPKGPPAVKTAELAKSAAITETEAPEPEQFDKSQADIYAMGFNERTAYNARLYDHRQEQFRTLAKSQIEAPLSKAQAIAEFYQSTQPMSATMTISEYNGLSPYQRRAVQQGLDPHLPDVPYSELSDSEMKGLAEAIKRRKYNIAEPTPIGGNVRTASQWD